MSRTTFSGPVRSGTIRENSYKNVGTTVVAQFAALATGALTSTVYVPAGARIIDVAVDVTTVFNPSGTAVLTIGKTSGGSEYVSGVDVKTAAGRLAPTFTAAQLTAMQNTSAQGVDIPSATTGTVVTSPLFIAITEGGTASSTGAASVTVLYVQADDRAGYANQP